MSTHHEFPKTTVKQFVLATLGGLFAPALVAFLIYKLVAGIQATHIEDADPAAAEAAVAERIKPVAEVNLASAGGGAAQQKSGEQVVQAVCAACHGSGALGSPKVGDSSAWGPRIAQGYDTLVKHAIEGVRMMPARGGSPDLTDHEVAMAVVYMANKSGASFKEPAAPAAPAAEAPADAAAAAPAPESAPAAAPAEAALAQ
jgi:cytochrome c5